PSSLVSLLKSNARMRRRSHARPFRPSFGTESSSSRRDVVMSSVPSVVSRGRTAVYSRCGPLSARVSGVSVDTVQVEPAPVCYLLDLTVAFRFVKCSVEWEKTLQGEEGGPVGREGPRKGEGVGERAPVRARRWLELPIGVADSRGRAIGAD